VTHESPAPEERADDDADAAPEEAPAASRPGSEERKERVLHTRVPAVLERELKRFAANLRVPVSNLVRAILEDAVNAADRATVNVENQLLSAVKQLEVERERIKKKVLSDPLEHAVAFQPVTLSKPAACAKCQCELPKGAAAQLVISEEPTSERLFACNACATNSSSEEP
jgi:hypothetical protein